VGQAFDDQFERAIFDVQGGVAGVSEGGRGGDCECGVGAGVGGDEGAGGLLRVEGRSDVVDEGDGFGSCARECEGELYLPVDSGDGIGPGAFCGFGGGEGFAEGEDWVDSFGAHGEAGRCGGDGGVFGVGGSELVDGCGGSFGWGVVGVLRGVPSGRER